MTETEAAWVREHVWPAAYREIDASYPNGFFGMCSCELGICGACDGTSDHGHARHDRCLSRQHGRPIIGSEASLTDGRAFVVGPSLWRADGHAQM